MTATPGEPAIQDGATSRTTLLLQGTQVTVIRVVGLGLAFGISLLVARRIGAAEYGRYEAWLAWVGIAAVIMGLGTEKMVTRFAAHYTALADLAALRGLLLRLGGLVAGVTLTLAAAVAIVLLAGSREDQSADPLLFGAMAAALTVLMRFVQAALTGLGRVVLAQSIDLLLLPLGFASAFLILTADRSGAIDAPCAQLGQLLSIGLSTAFAGTLFLRGLPPALRTVDARIEFRAWWSHAGSLLVLAILQIGLQRLDLAVFDLVGDDVELGHYAAARRIAGPVVAIVLAVNTAAAPVVARMHARSEIAELQALATRMARTTTAVAIGLAVPLFLLGSLVLSWFGAGFEHASTALHLLVVAQVFNAACGSVVLLLIMTGNTSSALSGLALANLAQAGLAWLLVPAQGAAGAAIAVAVGTLLWNLTLALTVWRRLHIDPSVLGRRAVFDTTGTDGSSTR